jgi:WD40 repeat protein
LATQAEFLALVWENINRAMQEHWIEGTIRESEKNPNAPFADVGPALKRLLALGASRQDLSLVVRLSNYEQAFTLLYKLSDPGIDDDEIDGLHESLLTADPSGLDGRPGSAPVLQTEPAPKSNRRKKKAVEPKKATASERTLLGRSERVCFSLDGRWLATLNGGLTLWKGPGIEEPENLATIGNACELAFSPDSRLLAIKNTTGQIVLIDLSTRTTKVDFRNTKDGQGTNIVFGADSQHVIDATWEGSHIARTLNGKTTFHERFDGEKVTGVLRHPDGRYWFRHEQRGYRMLGRTWPFRAGEFDEVAIPLDEYHDAIFSPDGRLLTLFADDRRFVVRFFSFPAMETLGSGVYPSLGMSARPAISISQCGRLLAVAGSRASLITNLDRPALYEGFKIQEPSDVVFSPTHSLVAIGSRTEGEVIDTTRFLKLPWPGDSDKF